MSEEAKDDTKLTAGTLRQWITDIVTEKFKDHAPEKKEETTPPAGTGPTETDIKGQVETALAALERRKQRDARDKDIDALLAERSAAAERPPVEPRRVHKIMGWGE